MTLATRSPWVSTLTRDLATRTESGDLFSAIQAMRHRQLHRLPALNRKDGPSGMPGADDTGSALRAPISALTEALAREHVHQMQTRV